MKRLTPLRVVIASVGLSLALALIGLGWSWLRFGLSDTAMAARLELDVHRTVDAKSAVIDSLAQRVAGEVSLIANAVESREQLSTLFERLQTLATEAGDRSVAVTVYVPASAPREFRVLAWSDGPGEQVSADQLAGPSALFVAPGHAGLRLIAIEPVQSGGQPIAVTVAETVLAPVDRSSAMSERRLATPYGLVTVTEHAVGASDATATHGFVVAGGTGAPLIDVRFDPATLTGHRQTFQRRALAVSLLPLPIGFSVLVTLLFDRRTPSSTLRTRWQRIGWIAGATAIVAAFWIGVVRLAGLPQLTASAVIAGAVLVVVMSLPAVLWWQTGRHRSGRVPLGQFLIEHLAGGLLLAAAIESVARVLERWMTLSVLARGPFVLFPFSPSHTLSIGTLLLIETAVAWLTASILAALAIRWHVMPTRRRTLATVTLWLLPTAGLMMWSGSIAGLAGGMLLGIGAVAVSFALAAAWLRRAYRRTTQSVRLLLALLAGLVPAVTFYPLAAVTADRATQRVIETSYAPATAGHPQELRAELRRAQTRVDEMPDLHDLVGGVPSADSQAAFVVWSQTGLERSRVISDVELYGPDRTLVSRFAFNLPEYVYRTTLQPWQGSSCAWEVFGEVTPFGAEERLMLHAERAVCDDAGQLLGGIVLHVASNDYQALPFVSSPSPYYDVLGGGDAGPRLPDMTLAVYGWSSQPIFTSGRAAWSVAPEIFDRLYRTGEPFWTTLDADNRAYRVHFSQNRSGVYALGYPRVTMIEHATRLAEIAALVAVFFVVWEITLLMHASLARRPHAPLRQLIREVRTSFYRKLFISFVGIAVVPVLAAAVAFGGYMTTTFRVDVEYEAATTVTVARRVFQELTAANERSVDLQAAPSDDVMVWIRQVIGHDVNLFDGPELVVTSQRDLFDSGFLPMRTPAVVYRAVALERRPTIVAEDRIGAFSYVVAGAPVPTRGRDAVLTVPLAPRQRDMERELDTLNRRVLVGAVFVVLFAAGVGASLAGRISDPVARLTRATRQIAAGRLDVRVTTDTADELRRLVDDFNSMAATLGAQREELARTNQLKAWNEMARQVAHEIKNPLTPVQLAAEHLQHVHEDRGRPLGAVLDRCISTVLAQVRLLRQIASEFANFAGEPVSRPSAIDVAALLREIVDPYRVGLGGRVTFDVQVPANLPPAWADRTLTSRALTNLVENAVQAMPSGGALRVTGRSAGGRLVLELADTGVGMDAVALEHAFEPFFSTKTGGSGLGLANAKRNIERQGGSVAIASEPGKGTTVTVTLPEAADPPAAPESGPRSFR